MRPTGRPAIFAAALLAFALPWTGPASGTQTCDASGEVGDAAWHAVQRQYRGVWPDAWLRVARSERVWLAVSRERGVVRVLAGDPPTVLREFALRDRAGRTLHFACAREISTRHSMVLHFREPVMWELFMAADAPVIFEGLVHDFRLGEGIGEPAGFPIRQIALPFPAAIMLPVPGRPEVIVAGESPGGGWQVGLMNLDVRRVIGGTTVDLPPQAVQFFCREHARILSMSDAAVGRVLLQLPGFKTVASIPESYAPCSGD